MKLSVHITHRNNKLQPVADELFSLDEYSTILANDVLRMITDVEDIIYCATGGTPREDWPDEVWGKFSRLKHKMLDEAGAMKRLPENLVYGGDDNGKHLSGSQEPDGNTYAV